MSDLPNKKPFLEEEQETARREALRPAIKNPEYSSDFSGWIEGSPPELHSPQWFGANHSDCNWIVSLQSGSAHVRLAVRGSRKIEKSLLDFLESERKKMRHVPVIFRTWRVEDGWIVGSESGEFGGGYLSWCSLDGNSDYQIGSGGHVSFFLETEIGLLAFGGLDHMDHSSGEIFLVEKTDPAGRWEQKTFVELDEAPYAAALRTDRSFLVVTSSKLLEITLDGQTTVLLDNLFWHGLYPNSVVSAPSGIYVGMRYGVARIIQEEQQLAVKWLLPNQNFIDFYPS